MHNAINKDLELHFSKNVAELEEKVSHVQLRQLAGEIAQKVLDREVGQNFGFLQMLKIAKISDQDFRYLGFTEIEEDLDNLYFGRKSKRKMLNLENQELYILEEFRLFNAMEKKDIPLAARQQEYCWSCNTLSTPLPKKKIQLKRPFIVHLLCCAHCNSTLLEPAYQHFTKQKIIDSYIG